MPEISYRRHRFPPAIIQRAVWLYLRFTLSYLVSRSTLRIFRAEAANQWRNAVAAA